MESFEGNKVDRYYFGLKRQGTSRKRKGIFECITIYVSDSKTVPDVSVSAKHIRIGSERFFGVL
jgi:hypothetical protein